MSSTSFRDRHPWRSQIRPQKCCVNNTFQDENKNLAHNWKQPNSINSNILTPILCIYFVAFVARHEKNFNTSRLVYEISSQIARVPKSHEKNYKWNKIILFDSLCYTAKKGNIQASNISFQLSAFPSFRDACNERHIFLPWLFLIPQRNLIGEDFDHVLGNHFWTVSRASHNQQNNAL